MNKKEIEKYIIQLQQEEEQFKTRSLQPAEPGKRRLPGFARIWEVSHYFFLCLFDFIGLYYKIRFNTDFLKNKKIVYTARNFCTVSDGKYEDRIVRPLFTENIVFINQSKEYALKKINDQKVYNLGGVVKFLSRFYIKQSRLMKFFNAYSFVNNIVLRSLTNKQEVYMLWFYDLNCLSLVFSKHKNNVTLIEVQHGSIVNYPPYSKPAPVKIADIFYVKNEPTAQYLKDHLCLGYSSEYRLIPYPKGNRKYMPGIHLLYASTIEFNGLHPVFKDFLSKANFENMHVKIRLHPRERDKETVFDAQLKETGVKYEFDRSKNWLEAAEAENMIVISPWSSTLEDAYDNGFIAITIDPVGKERYAHLIDEEKFFYSENLVDKIKVILKCEIFT